MTLTCNAELFADPSALLEELHSLGETFRVDSELSGRQRMSLKHPGSLGVRVRASGTNPVRRGCDAAARMLHANNDALQSSRLVLLVCIVPRDCEITLGDFAEMHEVIQPYFHADAQFHSAWEVNPDGTAEDIVVCLVAATSEPVPVRPALATVDGVPVSADGERQPG